MITGLSSNWTEPSLRRTRQGEELKRDLELKQGLNLTLAVRDIIRGLPATHVSLLFDTLLGELKKSATYQKTQM